MIRINNEPVKVQSAPQFEWKREEGRSSGRLHVLAKRDKAWPVWSVVDVDFKDMQYVIESDTLIKATGGWWIHDITLKEPIAYFDTVYPADRRFTGTLERTIKDVLEVYQRELMFFHGIQMEFEDLGEFQKQLPEKEYQGVNMSDILTDVFRRIKSIPRARFVGNTLEIHPEKYNARGEQITPNKIIHDQRTRDVVDHATQIKAQLKNSVHEDGLGTWWPNSKSYGTPRSEERRATQSSTFFDIDGKIWGIYEAIYLTEATLIPHADPEETLTRNFEIDVTENIVPKELYDLKPQTVAFLSDPNEELNATNMFHYEIGGDKIEALWDEIDKFLFIELTKQQPYEGVHNYNKGQYQDKYDIPVCQYPDVDTIGDLGNLYPGAGDVARVDETETEWIYDGAIWKDLESNTPRWLGEFADLATVQSINYVIEGDGFLNLGTNTDWIYEDGEWEDLEKYMFGIYGAGAPDNVYQSKLRIRYISQRDIDFIAGKHDVSELVAATALNNQGASRAEIGQFSEVVHTLANRLGNKSKTQTRLFRPDQRVWEVGDYTADNHIVVWANYTVHPTTTRMEYRLAKNFSIIDGETALSRRPSPFTVTSKDIQTNLVKVEYLEFSTDIKGKQTTFMSDDYVRTLLGAFKHSEDYADKIEDGYFRPLITDFTTNPSRRIHMPVVPVYRNNAVGYHVRMKDILNVEQLVYRGDDDYWRKVAAYTEDDGTLGEFEFSFGKALEHGDTEEVKDYPIVETHDDMIETSHLPVDLDANAAFAFTYQTMFVTDTPDEIVITENLSNHVPAVREIAGDAEVYVSDVPFNVFDTEVREHDTPLSDIDQYYTVNLIEDEGVYTLELVTTETPTNYAYVREGEILLAVNGNSAPKEIYIRPAVGLRDLSIIYWVTGSHTQTYSTDAEIALSKLFFDIEDGTHTQTYDTKAEIRTGDYTVTFLDYDDTVLKTEHVFEGEDATPPDDPEREGYDFDGWEGNYTNVQQDENVVATYEIKTYTVTFEDYDGTTLKTEEVEHGSDATPPDDPEREGYNFVDWDGNYTNVQQDETVTATYEIKTYTVNFVNDDTTLLKTEEVDHGEDATPPPDPERSEDPEDYQFDGWDKDYTNITSSKTLTAQYLEKIYTVTFKDYDDTVLKTEDVAPGYDATPPSDPTRDGYIFDGWHGNYTDVQQDETVTATYVEAANSWEYIGTEGDENAITDLGKHTEDSCRSPAEISADLTVANPPGDYELGFVMKVQHQTSTGTSCIDYYYEAVTAETYTVSFVDHDNTVLKTEEVVEGENATPPDDPERDGYVFTGWEPSYENITEDTTCVAQYNIKTAQPTISNVTWDTSEAEWRVTNEDGDTADLYSEIGDSDPTTVKADINTGEYATFNEDVDFTPFTIYARAKAAGKELSDYDSYFYSE